MAGNSVLVVPPFDCAWLMGEDQTFPAPGRGCVAFEARAANDVTVVFKDQPGCKHYRTDLGPNYTIILGSHCNRRLKMLVDGKTVVDVAGIVLRPATFERYWISVQDGRITVGKGEPGQSVVYEWADPSPNCRIKYVGLSSWDKHIGYRNVRVLPPAPVSGKYMPNLPDVQGIGGGLAQCLESADFSDIQFVIGPHQRVVCAHRVLLASSCTGFSHFDGDVVRLPAVNYPVLHAFLQYIYTGRTMVTRSDLSGLQELSEKFGLNCLALQCRELELAVSEEADFGNLTISKEDSKLELTYQSPVTVFQEQSTCALNIPVNPAVLVQHLDSGEFSDVELLVEDYGTVARAHRLILSAWSEPFAKMFTNGMSESSIGQVVIRDTEPEVFMAMLRFMYRGHLDLEERSDYWALLLPLLVLADQFAIQPLQQECCLRLLDCLAEDSACAILQVAASMPNCKALRDACEDCCARHFDYCIMPPAEDFQGLEASCLSQILQHPALSVISEEKVLDAIMIWGANKDDIHSWGDANQQAKIEGTALFQERFEDVKLLLPLVRFPLMALAVLQMLQISELCKLFPAMEDLVGEAIEYLCQDLTSSTLQQQEIFQSLDMRTQGRLVKFPRSTVRFSQRLSTFKELLYISDGDCNGVFYYLGTSFGQHPWMNPVLTKKLVVSASSPPSRFTYSKALVSRNYQGTSFAGPCIDGGQMSAWWKVDLGKDQQLLCNYYTVRQDSSSSFMRHWSLEGSMDGQRWTQLRTHHNDQTLSHGGQYASWPVFGANALLPFRFFRVVLLGPTTSASTPWNLSLCYLELYGYFR